MPTYAAVDLGATSGRVVAVDIDRNSIALELITRFPNELLTGADGSARWDFESLLTRVIDGLESARRRGPLRSVAIDSWAVDYGLLDVDGELLGPVHAYRSRRTDGVLDAVTRALGRQRIYEITGIQFLGFNTIYQLASAIGTADYERAARLLLIPDLINHALCSSTTIELTNASTTQLLDVASREWSDELIAAVGIRRDLLPALHRCGQRLGTIVPGRGIAHDSSLVGLPVVATASHDTASAVAGTPMRAERASIYISCGTWALVGCELAAPITSEHARRANVTNEVGWNDTTRLLQNVNGLFLLEECRRAWAREGVATDTGQLLGQAASLVGGVSVFDPDDPALVGAPDMPAAVRRVCRDSGQVEPSTPAEITRAILESLALGFRRAVRTIEAVAGIRAEVIHLVGGGSQNHLLARLTASACERPVLAGPTEATVIGNALIQAIADGVIDDLEQGRRLVERCFPPVELQPEQTYDWAALEARTSWMRA